MMLTVNSDLNGPNPQFTLTCISTGGPATTVAWTRDSTNVTQGAETVLNDPATAQYTHTLTVTGRLGGLYTCTVANEKPSSASSSFDIEGMFQRKLFVQHTHFHYDYCMVVLRTPLKWDASLKGNFNQQTRTLYPPCCGIWIRAVYDQALKCRAAQSKGIRRA